MKRNGRPLRRPANFSGDSEWEKVKGASRQLAHNEAVQESFFLQRQFRILWSDRMASSPVDLNQILAVLAKKKIPFVLTGAHGIGGWTGRPRDTHDVDILVKSGRNHGRAVKAIQSLYPQLEIRHFTGVTAFFVPGETQSVIDVIYPHRPDNEETLAHPVWVENRKGMRFRIPSLEAALANKYGAMLTPTRDPGKRIMDLADFTMMVKHSLDEGQKTIDMNKLASLGEMVWPGGGGKEILRLVEEAKMGKIPDLGMEKR